MGHRKEIILSSVNKAGLGLEIGPSHNPVAPKKAGFNVEVIDHASQEELRKKYEGHGVDLDAIEPVDYLWRGESYRELVGPEKHYDWIIASHVIEHVPDLAAFINNCSAVLKDDGILSLAVPDSRYCFDQFRPISGLSAVLDALHAGLKRHSPGSVMECFLNFSEKDGREAWTNKTEGANRLVNAGVEPTEMYRTAMSSTEYIDIHKWCFTPSSFRLIMADLGMLGLIDMKEVNFVGTQGFEFFVAMSKTQEKIDSPDRLSLLESIQQELAEPMMPKKSIKSKFRRWRKRR